MAHEHGPHTCYCPTCNYTIEVAAYTKCNTLSCPHDGTRLRAVETGEYRTVGGGVMVKTSTESLPCPVCKYPIQAPTAEGQQVKCVYCGAISEAIEQGVTIPTTLLVGLIAFGTGVLLGPSVQELIKGGPQYLGRKTGERFK